MWVIKTENVRPKESYEQMMNGTETWFQWYNFLFQYMDKHIEQVSKVVSRVMYAHSLIHYYEISTIDLAESLFICNN